MGEEDPHIPLLTEDGWYLKRTGNVWSAVAHIITAVIGSGVLSLAWCIAQLGWIVGPLALLFFAAVTLISSTLLCDCYRSPHPEHGHLRNRSYMAAVKFYLGKRKLWICGLVQHICLFWTATAYMITASISMSVIQRPNCFHKEGHVVDCAYGSILCILIFGIVQILFSQISNFHEMEWLSIIGAIMSFAYALIGLALGVTEVVDNGLIKGSIKGVPSSTTSQKLWNVSQALGDIAFSYPYSIVLIEIQDTLKPSPPENQTMKNASRIAIYITTFFYLCCGCFGYAAFGDQTPGNLLTGFGLYEPYWLIDFANACIIVHLVAGYQVYTQPVFSFLERSLVERYPDSWLVNTSYDISLPIFPIYRATLLRVTIRTIYVLSTTVVALLFPYFNQVLGVLGALGFWPLVIYFPVEMYIVQMKIVSWTRKWVCLQMFSLMCLLVALFALTGSFEGILNAN